MMNIRPSAVIRQNYNEIAETAELVFLTKNGKGDLVVMDIETFKTLIWMKCWPDGWLFLSCQTPDYNYVDRINTF